MYQKILVPLDGSPMAECSLEHVRTLATNCNTSEVILLQAVEPITIEALAALSAAGKDTLLAEEQNRAEAREYLNEISGRLQKLEVNTQVVLVDGHPADTILDYAKENQIDLIIMSTHGRTGLSKWF